MRPAEARQFEFRILRLLAEGKSQRQAARQLNVSEDSVRGYTHRLYARLGAVNAAHAVAIGYQRGLLVTAMAVTA